MKIIHGTETRTSGPSDDKCATEVGSVVNCDTDEENECDESQSFVSFLTEKWIKNNLVVGAGIRNVF